MSSLHHKATFAAQKNFSSACFFMPFYLANPNKSVTHTHTHTQERDQYKGTRDARVIYNIITYKQRVCKKFFINLLHALFHAYNQAVFVYKDGVKHNSEYIKVKG